MQQMIEFQGSFLLISLVGLAAFACGLLLASLVASKKREILLKENQAWLKNLETQLAQSKAEREALNSEIHDLRQYQLRSQQRLGELSQKAEQGLALEREKQQWQDRYQQAQQQAADLRTELEAQNARVAQEKHAFEEKVALLESAEQRLQAQFENLANKIFEQKSQSFSQHSKAGLDALLTPLKEQIEGFKRQINDQHVREGQERASLKTEILGLKALNQQITAEAAALTKALKGDNKKQGNWGEVVLERILRESGLRQGHEFDTQVTLKSPAGKSYQPDVVVHLPDLKDVVIDAKTSLAAYERYVNEPNESARQAHLQGHIVSLKNHIRELGKKDYQDLEGLRTLDYVLMFIPIESAFLLAIDQAPELYKLALDNNIMLVSPTNLLVALRTIHHIWQNEYQQRNAKQIAKKAAVMYDKFVAFIDDMESLGSGLQSAQKKYASAMNKLIEGRGNLVARAEAFRSLGVQPNKTLNIQQLEQSRDDSYTFKSD